MKLFELLESVAWPDIESGLLRCFPDAVQSLEAYRLMQEELRQLAPKESRMRIILQESFTEGFDDEPYTEVVGRNGRLNRELEDFKYFRDKVDEEYANAETNFALAFEPWECWIGMDIDPAILAEYPAPQIVALCLWEMSFHGFDQAGIKATSDELKRRADEVKAMTEEERKEKLIPLEEVMQRVGWSTEKANQTKERSQ